MERNKSSRSTSLTDLLTSHTYTCTLRPHPYPPYAEPLSVCCFLLSLCVCCNDFSKHCVSPLKCDSYFTTAGESRVEEAYFFSACDDIRLLSVPPWAWRELSRGAGSMSIYQIVHTKDRYQIRYMTLVMSDQVKRNTFFGHQLIDWCSHTKQNLILAKSDWYNI